jgi:hypothetical protein
MGWGKPLPRLFYGSPFLLRNQLCNLPPELGLDRLTTLKRLVRASSRTQWKEDS